MNNRAAEQKVYVPPRTFGDLLTRRARSAGNCTFCKRWNGTDGCGVRKYSTRHYICDPCIEQRTDVVLPAIRRCEQYARLLAKRPSFSAKAIAALAGVSVEFAEAAIRDESEAS